MTSIALPIPRVRRLRRPPARLVFFAVHVALDMLWLGTLLVAIAGQHQYLDILWAFFAVRITTRDHHRLRQVLSAWRRGEPVAPVRRREWCLLTIYGTLIALGAVVTVVTWR